MVVMGAKDTPKQDQKDYGDVKQEEQDAAMLEATAALEQQNAPQVDMPAPAAEAQPEGETEQAQTAAPVAAGVPQPRNLMQIVPSSLLFRDGNQTRLPSRQDYDAGQLWEVLAQEPSADPMIRLIAKQLMRRA
jgi:hypothetical protein